MSTHNICFCGEIRKIMFWILLLSGGMVLYKQCQQLKLLTMIKHGIAVLPC